ncbi:MAG: hypothetical protein MHPDNHAH_00442 [Anaerolineales bacterium]|nr:hypothetical protein [Anaerolineales bacterium]WKZ47391.1 MAG: hypothetical protein QY306_16385 [Anaerolineales bacterium]
MTKPSVTFVRPKDQSYEEYVKMIQKLCDHLGVPFEATESEMRKNYREYLANSKKGGASSQTAKPAKKSKKSLRSSHA